MLLPIDTVDADRKQMGKNASPGKPGDAEKARFSRCREIYFLSTWKVMTLV